MSRFRRRSRRRSSRALAIVLIVALAAGIFIAAQKIRGSRVNAAATDSAAQRTDRSPTARPAESDPWARAAANATIRTEFPASTDTKRSAVPPVVAPSQPPATQPAAVAEVSALAPAAPQFTFSGNPIAASQARLDANEPIAARKILGDALVAGRLTGTDAALAKATLAKINQEAIFGRRIFKDDPACTTYALKPGDTLQKVAAANGITWELLCRINAITDPRKVRAGQTLKIIKGPFHAVVTKSKFTMDLYLGSPGESGSIYATSFMVGLGKDDSTPAGIWVVDPHKKLKKPTYYSPRGEGVIAAGDPKNPLGDFWIGLAGVDGQAAGKMSYGIHGTIDAESIGKEESMGCIRLRNQDATLVFEMLVEGKSKVVVKD